MCNLESDWLFCCLNLQGHHGASTVCRGFLNRWLSFEITFQQIDTNWLLPWNQFVCKCVWIANRNPKTKVSLSLSTYINEQISLYRWFMYTRHLSSEICNPPQTQRKKLR